MLFSHSIDNKNTALVLTNCNRKNKKSRKTSFERLRKEEEILEAPCLFYLCHSVSADMDIAHLEEVDSGQLANAERGLKATGWIDSQQLQKETLWSGVSSTTC